jgi:DNA repair protein RadC
MGIKELAQDDRPREKLLQKGIISLSDSELLAIIMGSGNREQSAVELAQEILKSCQNNWHQLAKYNLVALCKFKGVGQAKAIAIMACLEIANRKDKQKTPEHPTISSSNDAYQLLRYDLQHKNTEEFWLILLNTANKVIYKTCLSKGGITSSVVDVRLLFKTALEQQATAIIIAHNHPSGSLLPSTEDKAITQKIKDAGHLLQIKLLDHLIISSEGFYSFADSSLI